MTIEIWKSIASGGANAVLFGAVLLILIPKMIAIFTAELRNTTKSFRDELAVEREAHHQENIALNDQIGKLVNATQEQTSEIRKQTVVFTDRFLPATKVKIRGV